MSEPTPFIPAKLDDYGLPSPEFRVLCNVIRRGECYAAIPSIARVCRLDPKTVKRAIKALAASGLIQRQFRLGETLLLKMTPVEQWPEPKPFDTSGVKQPSPNGTPGAKRADTSPKAHPTTSPKGHPTKVPLLKDPPLRVDQIDASAPVEGYRMNRQEKHAAWQISKGLFKPDGQRPDWNGLSDTEKMSRILGQDEINRNLDTWIRRYKTNPHWIKELLERMHSELQMGKVIKNRGGYAESVWKSINEEAVRRSRAG